MYRIIGADQKEYGPVTAEVVRQWIADGRANARSKVYPEGGAEWKTLADFPDFAAALAAKVGPPLLALGSEDKPLVAEEFLARDYDLAIGSCLSGGYDLLKNNFGLLFGGTALFLAIQFAAAILGFIPLLGILISLANFVASGPLTGGLYLLFLKAKRGHPAEVSEIFAGFKVALAQLFLANVVVALLSCLAALPGSVVIAGGVISMVVAHSPTPTGTLVVVVGALVVFVPIIYLSISWMFTLALVIDKQMDFWRAMELSRKMTGKHFWKCFLLLLMLGLINLGGVLVCGVGAIAKRCRVEVGRNATPQVCRI